jgi:hypothetical protein
MLSKGLMAFNALLSGRLSTSQKNKLRGIRNAASRFACLTLNDLARLYHTDKCDWHDYMGSYERHFALWRNQKINVLEIGIGGYEDPFAGCCSLRMWKA